MLTSNFNSDPSPHDGHEYDDNQPFDTEVEWMGMYFTAYVNDGAVTKLVCHSEPEEFVQKVYMVEPDCDLSSAVFRKTKCDFNDETVIEVAA